MNLFFRGGLKQNVCIYRNLVYNLLNVSVLFIMMHRHEYMTRCTTRWQKTTKNLISDTFMRCMHVGDGAEARVLSSAHTLTHTLTHTHTLDLKTRDVYLYLRLSKKASRFYLPSDQSETRSVLFT